MNVKRLPPRVCTVFRDLSPSLSLSLPLSSSRSFSSCHTLDPVLGNQETGRAASERRTALEKMESIVPIFSLSRKHTQKSFSIIAELIPLLEAVFAKMALKFELVSLAMRYTIPAPFNQFADFLINPFPALPSSLP